MPRYARAVVQTAEVPRIGRVRDECFPAQCRHGQALRAYLNCFRQGQGTVTIGPLGEGSYLVARHMGIRRSADDFDPLVASQAKGQQLAHQRRIVGDQGPNWSGWMPAHSKNSMGPLTGSCLRFPCSLLLLTCRRDRLPAQFKHRDLPLTGKYGHLAYLSSRAANKIWSNKVLRS